MVKISSLKVNQLNEILKANGVSITGTKAEKVAKLQELLNLDEIDQAELEDVCVNDLQTQIDGLKEVMANLTTAISAMNDQRRTSTSNTALEFSQENNANANAATMNPGNIWSIRQQSTTIQDMVGVMPEFDPIKGTITPQQFIQKVEQLKQCHRWQETMVLIAIQHKLKGMAKMWLDAQPVYGTWVEFVNAFYMDFPTTTNAAETHKAMSKRKRKNTEDYVEYYYAMLTLGRQGGIDEESIITHIISGLGDGSLSKTLAAIKFRSCSELLSALRNLKTAGNSMVSGINATTTTIQQYPKTEQKLTVKPTSQIKCFNCNEYGHMSAKCTQPQRKPKCTKCSKVGHNATECKTKTAVMAIDDDHVNDIPVTKTLEVNGKQFEAFIDTGSACSLIRMSAAEGMQTQDTEKRFIGFGGCEVHTSKKIDVHAVMGNIQRQVTLYLVQDNMIPYDVLLGRNALKDYGYRLANNEDIFSIHSNGNCFNISNLISSQERGKVLKLLLTYQSCFAEDIQQIGRCKNAEMSIEVTTTKPILGKRYQVPFAQRPALSKILRNLQENDIIRPSNSPHAASVLLVKKSNGEDRMCIDFRSLNEVTVKKNYLMPVVEEQLARLAGNEFFTTLDMTSGYYQIPMAEESKPYTAFLTHEGLFEHNVMPFGLVNAPMVFQEVIVKVIKTMKYRDKVVNYVDEVIIATKTFDEGLEVLQDFLEAINREGLTLRPSKSTILAKEVQFLGHIIDKNGIRPGENKTKVIEEFPVPTTTTAVRQFLGVTGYFRKFVKHYAISARPLTALLRKGTDFIWQQPESNAFEELKRAITTKPVLAMYDATKPHEVHTDASALGLSGVLMQNENGKWRPVFYFSRQCNDAERNYASYELEVLAIVETLQRYRTYLLGQHFKVVTDCNAVASTKASTALIPRIARWWLKLQEYDFECIHRSATKNALADGLSRCPSLPSSKPTTVADAVYSVVSISDDWVAAIQRQDEKIIDIIEILNGKPSTSAKQVKDDYVIEGARLFRKLGNNKRLVVPQGIRWRVTRACHDEAGHFGVDKTIERLSKYFWFARMRAYVKSYIDACPECCLNKAKGGKREAQLHLREVVPIPFQTVHLDHLGPFVKSKHGNCYVLVIVCAFTKHVVLKAVRNTKTAPVLTTLRDYMTTYGRPQCLVTDRGTAFTSKDFTKFIADYGIQHVKTAVRTPRANGQAERVNKTILTSLKCSSKNEKDWDEVLYQLQWCINSQRNATTRQSPNSLVFNYQLRDVTTNRLIQAMQEDGAVGDDLSHELKSDEVCERIRTEQIKWKQRFDSKHRKPRPYSIGDLVAIDNIPSPTGMSHKLEPVYKGPYQVTKVLPNDRYIVENLPNADKSRRSYMGIFTNDNMKPWCTLGPERYECDESSNEYESSRSDDESGRAELSTTDGNPSCQPQMATQKSE